MPTDLQSLTPTHSLPFALSEISDYQTATAHQVFASLAKNTQTQYGSALKQLQNWLTDTNQSFTGQTPEKTDLMLSDYLHHLFDSGKSITTLRLALAAINWWMKTTGRHSAMGLATQATLKRLAESDDAQGRGRGQANALTYEGAIAILTTAKPIDKAITALLFMAGLRRSEVATLRWHEISEGQDDTLLIRVTRSKTNRAGEHTDIRLVKGDFAQAIQALRSDTTREDDLVIGLQPQRIGQRFTAAAKAAGVPSHITAHSGRVGLASELTSRGASTTEVMLAGNWKTARMVGHYSAGATAERGAVAKYL